MKTKNYYTVILRSDSDEESFEDSSLRSDVKIKNPLFLEKGDNNYQFSDFLPVVKIIISETRADVRNTGIRDISLVFGIFSVGTEDVLEI